MDEAGFEAHRERLALLLLYLHRTTALLAAMSFGGYAVAGLYLWQGRWPVALGVASASYLFFRFFRPISLAVVRRIAALREELWPAMEWLDGQIAARGAAEVIAWLDERLFPKR